MSRIISRSTLSQTLAVMVKNMVLIGYGMAFCFPTILIPDLSRRNVDDPLHLGLEGISWIGSVNLVLIPVGCILSGIITKPLGRRRALQLINIPFFICWITYYFSTEVWHILAALSVTGFVGGLKVTPVLTYVAEISEPRLRGILISTANVSISAGIMMEFILGKFLEWKLAALCSLIIPLLTFLLLFLVPETPSWLVSKRRFEEAKQSLAWLRGWVPVDEVAKEYKELLLNSQMARHLEGHIVDQNNGRNVLRKRVSMVKMMRKRSFIRAFGLATFACFLAHFCGVSPVGVYAVNIFTSLGSPIDGHSATVVSGVVSMIAGLLSITIVGRLGRRLTSFISLAGTAITFSALGIYTHLNNMNTLLILKNLSDVKINSTEDSSRIHSSSISWFPFSTLILGVFSAQMGICILPWALVTEVFSYEIRDIAAGMITMNFYILGFLCIKTFFNYTSLLTLPGTFWFFSAVSVAGLVILYFVLPETEGKTVYEIHQHFSGKRKLGKTMNRRNCSVEEGSKQSENLHLREYI
ncbi:hypothetical protein WA026_014863 [Henosepilachna vigintioctopunctata]|uniref:Major facilitator superfamily (MFS) profile domain-containing protein n=1 Tax=Henosepilachna vigintioctopunctata TaxID=420089 RepID=A0AAW1UYA7_9CUCU